MRATVKTCKACRASGSRCAAHQAPWAGVRSKRKPSKVGHTKATTWKELRAHNLRNRPTIAERGMSAPLKDLGFSRSVALFGYIADFYRSDIDLVVEIDGPYHAERVAEDTMRDAHLAKRGIKTLRFTNNQVFENRAFVLMKIREAITKVQTLPSHHRAVGRNMEPTEGQSRGDAGVSRQA